MNIDMYYNVDVIRANTEYRREKHCIKIQFNGRDCYSDTPQTILYHRK